MSIEPEKMSINVFTNQKEKIMKSDQSCNEYILRMNEEYNNSNIELRLKVEDLNVKIDNLENDNDKQDSSIRYMKGLLKNYVELKMLYKTMNNKRVDYIKFNDKCIKEYYYLIFMCVAMYYVNLVIFLFVDIITIQTIFAALISLAISLGFCFNYYHMDRQLHNNKQIVNINDELKKDNKNIEEIEDGCDFISEYIDNL